MTQMDLFDPPRARLTDPGTSALAASEIESKLGLLQMRLVQVIGQFGPMTAAEAAARCSDIFGGMAESYRKRAGECCRAKALEACAPRKCSISGKLATVYRRVQ